MSYQQEKNCVHLLDLLNTFTVAVVEQEEGRGAHRDGVCRKNTEANKQFQVREVIRQEAGYTTNSA